MLEKCTAKKNQWQPKESGRVKNGVSGSWHPDQRHKINGNTGGWQNDW